jgi:hypothetical protein
VSVRRPMEVVVLNCCVTDTKDALCASKMSTILAKSASDRVKPQGGICRRGTLAGRLLLDIIRNADNGERIACAAADSYMQLAIYDLVGALFGLIADSRVFDRWGARIRSR